MKNKTSPSNTHLNLGAGSSERVRRRSKKRVYNDSGVWISCGSRTADGILRATCYLAFGVEILFIFIQQGFDRARLLSK